MDLILDIPEKIIQKLRERIKVEERPLEEFIMDAIWKEIPPEDPDARKEFHLKLCEKFLREGEEFLRKGDLVQASEKGWGAAAQMVKAVAAGKGQALRSHAQLWKFVEDLSEEIKEEEILSLWHVCNSLHTNFYESWASSRAVKRGLDDARRFIERLKSLT